MEIVRSIVLTLGASLVSFGVLGIVLLIFRIPEKKAIEGAQWGDCTDEMFEAMREVDALTPSVPPFLAAKLPPRSEWDGRLIQVAGSWVELPGQPKDVSKVMGDFRRACESVGLPFEIEFDPMTGKTREIR